MPVNSNRQNKKQTSSIHTGALQLFETMGQGVVYQSADGTIINANLSAERILGLTEKELQGRKLTDPTWKMICEDGSQLMDDQHPTMVALHTGKAVSNRVIGIYQPKSQKYGWAKVSALPEFLSGQDKPARVYTTFLDISEQKEIDHKLGERIKELQAFYALSEITESEDKNLENLYRRLINFTFR